MKIRVPFQALVQARGTLWPGGNIARMFAYATEINWGRGAKVTQVPGFE